MLNCITFVIINWNLKQDTADCIDSLLLAKANLENIIVVDNGSTDGSVEFLSNKYGPLLTTVDLATNMGFAKGSNSGIQRALDKQVEWVFLMNNDTLVDPDFVIELEKAILRGQAEFSLFSPLILYHSLPDHIWYLGDHLIPGTMIGVNPFHGKKEGELKVPDLFPIDFINGCGMLVHRKVFEMAGMMDTSLFIYHEEVDFCWRAREAGFRMAAVPKAKMWHKISSIMGKQKPKARYLWTRNQIWVYRRYSHGIKKIIMFSFSIYRALRLMVRDVGMNQMGLFPHTWRGFWDGWIGNPHQGEY